MMSSLATRVKEMYVNVVEPAIDRAGLFMTLMMMGDGGAHLLAKQFDNNAQLIPEIGAHTLAYLTTKPAKKLNRVLRTITRGALFLGVPYLFSTGDMDNYLVHLSLGGASWLTIHTANEVRADMKKQNKNLEEQLGFAEMSLGRRAFLKNAVFAGVGALLYNSVMPGKAPDPGPAREKRPAVWDNLRYTHLVDEIDLSDVNYSSKKHDKGRLQRALRWENLVKEVASKYDLDWRLLLGVIMQESYANPLQDNESGDGGLGLAHIQPLTGEWLGLKIYGESSGDFHDPKNGQSIRELLLRCNYDLVCVAESDDRAHPILNVDAIARYIAHYKSVYENDEKRGVKAVKGPTSPSRHIYLKNVERWAALLNDEKKVAAAKEEFNRMNRHTKIYKNGKVIQEGITYDELVVYHNHNMNNWGLDIYRDLPKKDLSGLIN